MVQPSPESLRAFVAVADTLHFGRAAETLFVTTPALSQQIQRLERLLGATLFTRSSRQVELTEKGRELLPLARDAVEANQRITAWARRQRGESLCIGFTHVGPPGFTLAVFARAAELLSSLRLELRQVQIDQVPEELRSGTIDLAFVWGPHRYSGVVCRKVWDEPRVLLLGASNELAVTEGRLCLSDLADVPFLIPSSNDRSYVDWAIVDPRPGGRRPRVGPVVRNFDEALANVAAGLGVYLVPKAVADAVAHVDVVARDVEDVEPSPYLMCYLERNARGATATYIALVEEVMASYA